MTEAQAWPVLRRHLALLALDNEDPVAALQRAATASLHDAVDPAAVLSARLQPPPTGRVGPLRWLPAHPRHVGHRSRAGGRTWRTARTWSRPWPPRSVRRQHDGSAAPPRRGRDRCWRTSPG